MRSSLSLRQLQLSGSRVIFCTMVLKVEQVLLFRSHGSTKINIRTGTYPGNTNRGGTLGFTFIFARQRKEPIRERANIEIQDLLCA